MASNGSFGPDPIRIDWDEFDKLVSYDCTQAEIASFFNCSVDTLDRACQRDRACRLAEVWDKKKLLGRVKLKKIQMKLAEEGSTAMAIYLGKVRLGQTDTPIDKELLSLIGESGMSRDELLQMIMGEATKKAQDTGKKTFEQFCETAGYPKPFQKQIEMMKFGLENHEPRLLLGSRGYGKTDYITIMGIAYFIYLDPMNETNLIVTKSSERNEAIINEIASALEKNGITLEKQNASCLRVSGLSGKDHSVSAVTIKTVSLRGRHPKRILLDDPVTEDDTSEAQRKLVEKKYNEIMKLDTNILVIGQPAHKHDLYAKLRGLLLKMEVPHGTIPELDHDIEAQRLAGVSEASISASYHLKILSEGSTPFDKIKILEGEFRPAQSVAYIDPSHKGGDYTAVSIFSNHMEAMAIEGFCFKKAWSHCLDEFVSHCKRLNVKRLAFETNNLGDMPIDILRKVFKEAGLTIGIVAINSTSNKHSTIMAAGAYAHMIHLSKNSDKTYHDQVIEYEYNAKYDDAPDSLARGLEWIGLIRGKK